MFEITFLIFTTIGKMQGYFSIHFILIIGQNISGSPQLENWLHLQSSKWALIGNNSVCYFDAESVIKSPLWALIAAKPSFIMPMIKCDERNFVYVLLVQRTTEESSAEGDSLVLRQTPPHGCRLTANHITGMKYLVLYHLKPALTDTLVISGTDFFYSN